MNVKAFIMFIIYLKLFLYIRVKRANNIKARVMRNNILKVAVLAVALVLSVPVNAQQEGRGKQNKNAQHNKPDSDQVIARLDTNNDGKIDKEEASQAPRGKLVENFDNLDSNNDGYVVLEELEARGASGNKNKQKGKPSPEKVFEMVDNNNDGQLDKLEVAAKDRGRLEENFATIDTNSDDAISMEELKVFHESNRSKGKSNGKKKRNKGNS